LRIALTILLTLTCALCKAQVNLVLNPSFEQYSICPGYNDGIKYADHWMSLDSNWNPPDWTTDSPGVPEYCNLCSDSLCCRIPNGFGYYHYPRTGNGMAQVQMFYNDYSTNVTYRRDYLQGHLLHTLVAGQAYCVTFYVVLEFCPFAVNNISAYFDDGSIDTTNRFGLIQSSYTPQVTESALIFDTLNWTKIEGSFIAIGTERLITIGNFRDTPYTSYALVPGASPFSGNGFSWYLVDDVSVIRSDAVANAGPDKSIAAGDIVTIGDTLETYLPVYWYLNGTVIDSNKASIQVHPDTTTRYVVSMQLCSADITYDTVTVWVVSEGALQMSRSANERVWPNPADDQLNVTVLTENTAYRLLNITGMCVQQAELKTGDNVLSMIGITQGVYILEMTGNSGQRSIVRVVKK
jgi:hypothetical protein